MLISFDHLATSPWGKYVSFPVLCAASKVPCPGISNLHRHCLLRTSVHTLVEWSLGYSFRVPEIITIGQDRIQTMDLSIYLSSKALQPRVQSMSRFSKHFVQENSVVFRIIL